MIQKVTKKEKVKSVVEKKVPMVPEKKVPIVVENKVPIKYDENWQILPEKKVPIVPEAIELLDYQKGTSSKNFWNNEAKEKLKAGLRKHGKDWPKVRIEFLPDRTVQSLKAFSTKLK